MVDNMDNFMAGVVASFKPVPTQELAVEVSNAYNNKFNEFYGASSIAREALGYRNLEASKAPLTYIANWNGSFLDGTLVGRGACKLRRVTSIVACSFWANNSTSTSCNGM